MKNMNRKLYKTKFDSRAIVIHTPEDFEGMRRAGHLSASCLDMITDYVDIGVSTERLDDLIAQYLVITAPSVPRWVIVVIPKIAASASTKSCVMGSQARILF